MSSWSWPGEQAPRDDFRQTQPHGSQTGVNLPIVTDSHLETGLVSKISVPHLETNLVQIQKTSIAISKKSFLQYICNLRNPGSFMGGSSLLTPRLSSWCTKTSETLTLPQANMEVQAAPSLRPRGKSALLLGSAGSFRTSALLWACRVKPWSFDLRQMRPRDTTAEML